METKSEIGIVIAGAAGERGAAALEALPRLQATVRARGIDLQLVGVADARPEMRAALARKATALAGAECLVTGMLAEAIAPALRWLGHRTDRRLIVYDATPTAHHYLNLMTILPHSEREQIYYFGEKPLFTNLGEAQFVERHFGGLTFFCEFIETENPAFRAAREFIASENFEIRRMWFWRASCMGVSVAAGDGRGGVEGGALLDKAPHDLSVAVGLLGARALADWSLGKPRTHLLALHESSFSHNAKKFLSISNTALNTLQRRDAIPEQLPAHALVTFDVDFTLADTTMVPASFIASWVGLQMTPAEATLAGKLESLGIRSGEWLNSEAPRTSMNGRYRYSNQEARLCLLEGILQGRSVHLVVNLLAKFEGRRFVHLVNERGERQVIFEEPVGRGYHESKEADLLRVFERVVTHSAGGAEAENAGPEATLLVHKILLSAQDAASEQLRALDEEKACAASQRAYRKYLLPAKIPVKNKPSSARATAPA